MKEQIHEYCHRLHLPAMAERWPAMAEYAATHNIPFGVFIPLIRGGNHRKTGTIDPNAHQIIQTALSQDD